jgi:hypothetical protein
MAIGTFVTIEVTNLVTNDPTGYQCDFGGERVNATMINATAIECVSPAASQTGLINVSVYFEGKVFTPDLLYFTYYSLVYFGSNYSHILDCSDYEDDCYGCTAIPSECYWCIPGGCSTFCSGLGLTNECPSNVYSISTLIF